MSDNHPYLNFDEYIRQGEPSQKEKALNWETAIGLQAVDGLHVSDYLRETAQKHIEGEISSDEVKRRIKEYYQTKTKREPDDDERQEADSVSSNIQEILATNTLDFSVRGYMALHRKIFDGVFKHAGKLRECDITKKEWVLEWDTVDYLFWQDLHRALEYDIAKEREFSYKGISQDDLIKHIARFTSDLWQIHPFMEGNTRTTAVFVMQYLKAIGFNINKDVFAKHSWYFRNALVRANYRNVAKGINYEPIFLVRFFRNLLLGENNTLKNRYMMINPPEEWKIPENEQVLEKISI
jgi:fido (protein-threonine AMPylation protein)